MRALVVSVLVLAVAVGPASARPGDFDPSFGHEGVFVGAGGTPMDSVEQLIRLPDGALLALGAGQRFGGYGGVLAKLRPDGTYDRSFGWDGHAPTVGPYYSTMLRRPDGRIVVAGVSGFYAGPLVVERFLPDGDPDPSFGEGGRVELDPWRVDGSHNNADYVGGAALDRRGRIVVAARVARADRSFLGLVRLEPDGEIDPSFGDGGVVRHAPRGRLAWASANDLIVYPTGELLVAGALNDGDFHSAGVPVLVRFRRGGRVDERFGRRGTVRSYASIVGAGYQAVVRTPGGRLIAATTGGVSDYEATKWIIRRFRPDGSLDRSFGRRGGTQITLREAESAEGSGISTNLTLQPDGKLLVAGAQTFSYRFDSDSAVAVARLLKTGARDREFGANGLIQPQLGARAQTMYDSFSGYEQANDVLVLPDERVLLGGSTLRAVPGYPNATESEYMLARLSDSVAPRALRKLPRSIALDEAGEGSVVLGCREAGPACWARVRLGRAVDELAQLEPGRLTRVPLTLTDRGRRALERSGRMRVRATVRLRDGNGNSNTLSRTVALRLR